MKALKTISMITLVVLLGVAPLAIDSPYTFHLLIMVAVYIMLSQGLNILVGYVGLLSLGQQAYLAIGAYTSALLALKLGVSFWISLPLAILVTTLAGLFVGYITLRLRGAYFVIVTIGFAEIVRLLVLNIEELGGAPGLRNIPAPVIHIGNLINLEFHHTKLPHYYLIWIMAGLAILITSRLMQSRQGRAFVAMRENEQLAQAVGINPFGHAMLAFVVAVGLAGSAGAFYAHYISHISPEIAAFAWTLSSLIMVVVGGQGTIWGPVVGAFIFTFLPEWLRIAKDFRLPIYGMILMLAVLFFPQGLRPMFDQILDGLRSRLRSGDRSVVLMGAGAPHDETLYRREAPGEMDEKLMDQREL